MNSIHGSFGAAAAWMWLVDWVKMATVKDAFLGCCFHTKSYPKLVEILENRRKSPRKSRKPSKNPMASGMPVVFLRYKMRWKRRCAGSWRGLYGPRTSCGPLGRRAVASVVSWRICLGMFHGLWEEVFELVNNVSKTKKDFQTYLLLIKHDEIPLLSGNAEIPQPPLEENGQFQAAVGVPHVGLIVRGAWCVDRRGWVSFRSKRKAKTKRGWMHSPLMG